jgi:thiol peroxidase
MADQRTTKMKGNPLVLVGSALKPGDPAPDFELADNGLQSVKLADTGRGVRIFSVVPSLDTPVCDAQTRRFNEEAAGLSDVTVYTVSVDLPFAQKRWCGAAGVDRVKTLSDYKDGNFGEAWGTMIHGLRLESRAVFVVDGNNQVTYAEYVPEVTEHPDYNAALAAARKTAGV